MNKLVPAKILALRYINLCLANDGYVEEDKLLDFLLLVNYYVGGKLLFDDSRYYRVMTNRGYHILPESLMECYVKSKEKKVAFARYLKENIAFRHWLIAEHSEPVNQIVKETSALLDLYEMTKKRAHNFNKYLEKIPLTIVKEDSLKPVDYMGVIEPKDMLEFYNKLANTKTIKDFFNMSNIKNVALISGLGLLLGLSIGFLF